MTPQCTFEDRLAASKLQRNDEYIKRVLMQRVPAVTGIEIADTSDDKNGTDYWAEREWLESLSIDVKFRFTDLAPRYDDLTIETWSVCERDPYDEDRVVAYKKVGWCRDESKQTDYAMWFWVPTKRFFLVPFPPLCHVVQRHWETWRAERERFPRNSPRGICLQDTTDRRTGRVLWSSEHIYVPRVVLVEKLEHWMSGHLK